MVKLFSIAAVMGTDVLTSDHISLGSLKDFIYDTQSGKLTYYIIEAGAYLDLEDQLYVVHQRHFRWHPDEEILIFKGSLTDVQDDWFPELPEYYEEVPLAFGEDFARLLNQFIAPPSHRTDREGL